MHWFDAALKLAALMMVLVDVMLARQKLKSFSGENAEMSEKIKPILIYAGITVVGMVVLFGLHVIFYMTPVKSLCNFVDSVINGCLDRLPLTLIFMWLFIPMILMYFFFILKGGLHYRKKEQEFKKNEQEKKEKELAEKPAEIDYDSLLNFEIDSPMKFRQFMKDCDSEIRYTKVKNEYWIAVGNEEQSAGLNQSVKSVVKEFPCVLHSTDKKTWEPIETKDALKYVRKLLKEGA
mgnify:FL=1